ncbi:MAG: ATP-binding protein [Bacilli bacterium]|nr:ATP-binding protein [Bacilli bacterium]
MKAKVKNIVDSFKVKISILQVLYEALSNSLEANAQNIKIVFHTVPSIVDSKVYDSFSIFDDGDGFNQDNIDSFLEYLSTYKLGLGCKGVGRFTWLKAFSMVKINSQIKTKRVIINFSKEFDEANEECLSIIDNVSSKKVAVNETRIDFTECILNQNNYVFLPLEEIRKTILNTFAIKLFLLNEKGRNFFIEISDDSEENKQTITNKDLLILKKVLFTMSKDSYSESFKLYYRFIKDGAKKRQIVLCADDRGITDINEKGDIISSLPNDDSMICLVKSNYLNNSVNDSRTGFVFGNSENALFSFSSKEIQEEITKQIEKIIVSEYPAVVEDNAKKKLECINKYPYLKKYIEEDDSIIVDEKKLISASETKYGKDKEKALDEVSKIFMVDDINREELVEGIVNLSDFSNRELSKYFLYRQQVIDCLAKYIERNEPVEKLLHDLFIPQGLVLGESLKDRLKNNIWLLDDKFMSCNNAFSDKKVKKILEEIKNADIADGVDDAVEPDLALFYSNKSAVVVEFKALGADYNKKIDAISEIDRNNGIIAANLEDINALYGFIITSFDDVFLNRIKKIHGIKRMFDNNDEHMFYYYNENILNADNKPIPCHTYIISAKTICADANARNKLFIDIIKNNE